MLNKTKTILCILFFCILQEVKPTRTQTPTLHPFYALTQNITTKNTTIWQIDFSQNTTTIYTLSNHSALGANDSFSPHELAAIDTAISQGLVPNTIKSQTINQSIQKIWGLDSNRILALTRNGYCFVASERICFGYYEFLLITAQPQSIRSLFKIDFNDSLSDFWGSCSNYPLAIESTIPNPVYDKFVVTLIPEPSCTIENKKLAQSLIIDFEHEKVAINKLSLFSDQPVWAPSGDKLAFISNTPQCSSTGCLGEITIYDVQSSQSTPIATSSTLPVFSMFTAWKDAQSILYRWYAPIDSFSGNHLLVSYNLQTAAKQQWVLLDEQLMRVGHKSE